MAQDKRVIFQCPEGHRIVLSPSEIEDKKTLCEQCKKEYKFREVDLKAEKDDDSE